GDPGEVGTADVQALADWIEAGKPPSREGIVDERDARHAGAVAIGEEASAAKRNAHRFAIFRTDRIPQGAVVVFCGFYRRRFELCAVLHENSAERQLRRESGGHDSWQLADSIQRAIEKAMRGPGVAELPSGNLYLHRQQV